MYLSIYIYIKEQHLRIYSKKGFSGYRKVTGKTVMKYKKYVITNIIRPSFISSKTSITKAWLTISLRAFHTKKVKKAETRPKCRISITTMMDCFDAFFFL